MVDSICFYDIDDDYIDDIYVKALLAFDVGIGCTIKHTNKKYITLKSVKRIFKEIYKINLVHIKEAPLPKKITVMLSKDIFDFSKFNRISKIIDTRGLEVTSNTDRIDIKSIFRDGENNILLFVDKFNSPSKSIIDLVDHYTFRWNGYS